MAGRHFSSTGNPRSRSPILLFVLCLLCLPLIFYIFSVFSSPSHIIPIHTSQKPTSINPDVEYSFVASLEKFLTSKIQTSRKVIDDTVGTVSEEDVHKLDDLIWKKETERLYSDSFYPAFSSALRVYVYEMPDKFTYDMLWLFRNTYKDTSNLTSNGSPIHRLIEQVFIWGLFWWPLLNAEY